jgi:hypothetical protein
MHGGRHSFFNNPYVRRHYFSNFLEPLLNTIMAGVILSNGVKPNGRRIAVFEPHQNIEDGIRNLPLLAFDCPSHRLRECNKLVGHGWSVVPKPSLRMPTGQPPGFSYTGRSSINGASESSSAPSRSHSCVTTTHSSNPSEASLYPLSKKCSLVSL